MSHILFTSESVSSGHPDKVADQISDAVLDACLRQDSRARVACEVMVTTGLVVVGGEVSTSAQLDYQTIVRDIVREIGYEDTDLGFDYRSCGILVAVNKQSPDISLGVDMPCQEGHGERLGAGDQGLMFGFACDETDELMPLPIALSHSLIRSLEQKRRAGELPYLRPDAKVQCTVEYGERYEPRRLHTVVLSTQHAPDAPAELIQSDMKALVQEVVPPKFLDDQTIFHINPTGRFVVGGPAADCGLTGRKTIVDTYGGMGRHGGGAFSGKDPTKVDRSGAYAARYAAKNIVAAGLARRCEVQLSYAIGVAEPLAVNVDTFGTGIVGDRSLAKVVSELFDFTPHGMITALELARPIYVPTAVGGHFGRNDPFFTWERTDRVEALRSAAASHR